MGEAGTGCHTGQVDELTTERVLRAVECIPAGRVATYGQIADLAGTGARQVGRLMATWGATVAWWRVVNVAGRLPAQLSQRALSAWASEGTPVDRDVPAVVVAQAQVSANALATAYTLACADLPASL